MLFETKNVTVGQKIATFAVLRVLEFKSFSVEVLVFGFQFVQLTYLWPLWNSLAQVHNV